MEFESFNVYRENHKVIKITGIQLAYFNPALSEFHNNEKTLIIIQLDRLYNHQEPYEPLY